MLDHGLVRIGTNPMSRASASSALCVIAMKAVREEQGSAGLSTPPSSKKCTGRQQRRDGGTRCGNKRR